MKKISSKITYWAKEIVVVLLVLMAGLAIGSMWNDSATVDEIAHIPSGYSYNDAHDYRLNPEHPPLAKMFSGLPLLFLDLEFPYNERAWMQDVNGQWEAGWSFLYKLGNDADQMLLFARIPMVVIGLLAGIFTYLWAKDLFGPVAAVVAIFFFALSPNLIAHTRYVTTDVAASLGLLAALYFYVKFVKNPSWKLLFLSIFGLSLAQLLKYSDFVLYIMFALLALGAIFWRPEEMPRGFFLEWLFKRRWLKKTWVYGGSLALIVFASFVVISAVYALVMYQMPVEKMQDLIVVGLPGENEAWARQGLLAMIEQPLLRPFAQWLIGLGMVFLRVAGGNTTYFLGQTSNQSWWYFYPVAVLIKTPLPTLMLSLMALVSSLFVGISFVRKAFADLPIAFFSKVSEVWTRVGVGFWRNYGAWTAMMVIVVFMATGVLGNLNIGLRHVLPFYPFWFILLGGFVVWLFKKSKQNAKPAFFGMIAVLMIWYGASNLLTFPHYLAYFNETVGGYSNGHMYMSDSNVDWGQDLRRLADFVEKNKIEKIRVDYFGGGLPEYYLKDRYVRHTSNDGPTKGWFAVSATYFQNSFYYSRVQGEKDYGWLKKYEPVEIIGGSILVYNID